MHVGLLQFPSAAKLPEVGHFTRNHSVGLMHARPAGNPSWIQLNRYRLTTGKQGHRYPAHLHRQHKRYRKMKQQQKFLSSDYFWMHWKQHNHISHWGWQQQDFRAEKSSWAPHTDVAVGVTAPSQGQWWRPRSGHQLSINLLTDTAAEDDQTPVLWATDQPITLPDKWQAPIVAMQVNSISDACRVALENPISCRSLAKRQQTVCYVLIQIPAGSWEASAQFNIVPQHSSVTGCSQQAWYAKCIFESWSSDFSPPVSQSHRITFSNQMKGDTICLDVFVMEEQRIYSFLGLSTVLAVNEIIT